MKVLFCSRKFIKGVLLWDNKRNFVFDSIASLGRLKFITLREFFAAIERTDRRERGAINTTKYRRRATDIHVIPKPKQPFFPA
jgi:hypothetical protein